MSKLKKIVDEMVDKKSTELDLPDKQIANFQDVSGIRKCSDMSCNLVIILRIRTMGRRSVRTYVRGTVSTLVA